MNKIIKTNDLKKIKRDVEAYTDIEECVVCFSDDCSIIIGDKEDYIELDVRAFNSVEEMIAYAIDSLCYYRPLRRR